MPDAHSLRTAHGHAPRRTDVAPGLEVSLRYILQDLFVQRQIRDQPLQLAVLFLQFLHPLCLVHLQTAVFLPPAVERLDGDLGFFAGLGVVFPFAMLTSICRSIVTICSGLYLLIGMFRFSSKWILSHSPGTNLAGQVTLLLRLRRPAGYGFPPNLVRKTAEKISPEPP